MIEYVHNEGVHNLTSPREIVPIIIEITAPKSVIDLGCGTGTWLKAFEEHQVVDFLGVDGSNVDQSLLKISVENFLIHDFRTPLRLNRKFDLALCLEVVEHLPESAAESMIRSIVNCSDLVLFSAAIPGQGGQNHINEQWLSYWKEKFNQHQFEMHDIIRPLLWQNTKIDIWYRQNMVFFCKKGNPREGDLLKLRATFVDLVHPELFEFYWRLAQRAALLEEGRAGLRIALNALWKALVGKLKG